MSILSFDIYKNLDSQSKYIKKCITQTVKSQATKQHFVKILTTLGDN